MFIVVQGAKRAFVGDDEYRYDEDHYLVTAVPMPVRSGVVDASSQRPFLSVSVTVDVDVVREMVAQGGPAFQGFPPAESQRGLAVSPVSNALRDATGRLLGLLDSPQDAAVLGRLWVREIVYRVLVGPQGGFLRAMAMGHGHEGAIADVLATIHEDCTRDFTIAKLATVAGMSESKFYESFRMVTASSPLQYIKRLRLLEAKRQLTTGASNVSQAAYGVGYNSTSQFSREFKRVFGVAPSLVRAR